MTITEIQNNAKTKMEKTKDVLRGDLMAIRAGRANPQLLDRITVDYYGTPTPLKNVANISAPEPRVLQINPWDAKMVKDISKAIQASDLGLTPSNDGKVIRLMLPELTVYSSVTLTPNLRCTPYMAAASLSLFPVSFSSPVAVKVSGMSYTFLKRKHHTSTYLVPST